MWGLPALLGVLTKHNKRVHIVGERVSIVIS